jgi:pyruvate/2-oxoglutarate dehydrogenase complex dihydrolipoamide acyltransferase (E2) component
MSKHVIGIVVGGLLALSGAGCKQEAALAGQTAAAPAPTPSEAPTLAPAAAPTTPTPATTGPWSDDVRAAFLRGEALAYNPKQQMVFVALASDIDDEITVQRVQLYAFEARTMRRVRTEVASFATVDAGSAKGQAAAAPAFVDTVPLAGTALGYQTDPASGEVRGPKSVPLGKAKLSFVSKTARLAVAAPGHTESMNLRDGTTTPVPLRSFVTTDGKMGLVLLAREGDSFKVHELVEFELQHRPAAGEEPNDLQEFNGENDGLDEAAADDKT